MSDKTKLLPQEGVRRFVPREYASPHRSFLASTVRNYVSDVEVIVYPAECSIVDEMAEALEWLADKLADEAAKYSTTALRHQHRMDPVRRARDILARYREGVS